MKTAACQFLAVMFVAPCALIGLIQAQTVSDGDSVCPVSVELRTPNTFGREESGKTIFIEIRAAERRTETFLPQLNSLESLLLSRGMRIDRVWAGVKHLYLRINASGVSDAARGDIVAELKAQPLVGKLFSSATANYELRDLGQLEPALSISGLSEAKLRGFREKRRDFKPDLTGRDTGEIIVKYIEAETAPLGRRAVARARMGLLHAAVGARVVQSLDLSTGFADVVALPEGVDTRAVLERYLSDESVEYAEPNHVYSAFSTPNDTYYSYQWGMSKISAPDAWDVRTSASSVVVAVTDTGIDYNHNDLYGNLWQSG